MPTSQEAVHPAAPALILLCGRSFSGKSTIARQLGARLPAAVVSLDAINEARGLLGGQGIPVEERERTHQEASQMVRDELGRGRHVVVDDTSSPRFVRDRWRALAADADAQFVLLFVDTPLETIRDRHAENRGSATRHDVTDAVLAEHLAGFEPPSADEEHISTGSLPTTDETLERVRAAIG